MEKVGIRPGIAKLDGKKLIWVWADRWYTATPKELAAAIIECIDAGARVINLSLALPPKGNSSWRRPSIRPPKRDVNLRVLSRQKNNDMPAQPNWRNCRKCQVMFFNGFKTKGEVPSDVL